MKLFGKIIFNTIYLSLVLAVLAVALLFLGTKIDLFGYEVKIVKSGSMEPSIMTGGIVVISPTVVYNIGDIITYSRGSKEQLSVTHRIIEKTGDGERIMYRTKGDANEDVDPDPVDHRAILGKVAFTFPYVGYVIEFARTPLGFGLLIGLPALFVILDEFANIVWEFRVSAARRKKSVFSPSRYSFVPHGLDEHGSPNRAPIRPHESRANEYDLHIKSGL